MQTFILKGDYIELNKLLKFYWLVETGGEAKSAIAAWLVTVNGKQEFRVRNKLVAGDIVKFAQEEIQIVLA
jgi:ribosome-associated protein